MEDLDLLIHTYYQALWRTCDQMPSQLAQFEHVPKHKKSHVDYITAYGKSYCKYSNAAQDLLKDVDHGIYFDMEADDFEPANKTHAMVIAQADTIPIVFVNDEHIGGLAELEKLFA